jgi:23S rRNA (uridine2552-2'-O)-methyltransferase
MAKRAGYRSRAAFKLKQLDGRYKLLRRGDVVVDLGAAPGGWLQVARERVGSEGFVLGVDLQPIEKMPYENVGALVADITDPNTWARIKNKLPKPANVVISDASPKISGIWDVDHAKSVELARATLNLSGKILRPGGRMLIKVFQGELFDDFVVNVQRKFSFVKISKPKASRKRSAEAYVIAKKFKCTARPGL